VSIHCYTTNKHSDPSYKGDAVGRPCRVISPDTIMFSGVSTRGPVDSDLRPAGRTMTYSMPLAGGQGLYTLLPFPAQLGHL